MTNASNLIDSIEIYTLSNPDDVKPHWVSHFIVPTANELLIKIKNKDGNSGFVPDAGKIITGSEVLKISLILSNTLRPNSAKSGPL